MRWTDPTALRKASALGSFADESFLPIRYGRTAGKCSRMNAAGTRWLWADHAVDGVDAVKLNGEKINGWVFANEVDSTGRAIAVITLTEAADAGAELFASGRGKPGLTNPADVACDALGLDAGQMPKFRAECARRGYIAAGSITEPVTRQALARSIAASFGAIFTPGLLIAFPDLSAPVDVEPGSIQTAGAPVGEVVASFDYADGSARQTVTLRAQTGDAEGVALEWIQSQRVAIAVAKLIAIERSGQLWAFDFTRRSSARINAGAAVSFDLAPFGARAALVTESAFDFEATSGTAEFRMPGATTATLVHQSAKFDAEAGGGATITRVGDAFVLTVLDPDNDLPLSNAKCTLDARMTRYTDGAGKVTFPASAVDDGLPHTIKVEAVGRAAFDVVI